MHLATWGQSCFLYCSCTNSLFTVRDGECCRHCLSHPPSSSSSWWLPNSCLCFTWGEEFAFGKGLLTGSTEQKIFHFTPVTGRRAFLTGVGMVVEIHLPKSTTQFLAHRSCQEMFTTASHTFTLLPTYIGICTFKLQGSLEQYGFELHGSTCMWIFFISKYWILQNYTICSWLNLWIGRNCGFGVPAVYYAQIFGCSEDHYLYSFFRDQLYILITGFMVYLWKIPKLYSLLSDSAYQICGEKKSLLNSLSGNLEINSILGK